MDTLVSHSEQDKSAQHMGLVHSLSHNETDAAELAPSSLMKRTAGGRDARWEMSQISHPRGQFIWGTPGRAGGNSYKDGKWRFAYDDSIGGDQYVYVMGEATENTWYEHNVCSPSSLWSCGLAIASTVSERHTDSATAIRRSRKTSSLTFPIG